MGVPLAGANVLTTWSMADHQSRKKAGRWLVEQSGFALCPITQGALVRTLFHYGADAKTAATVLEGLRNKPGYEFWPDSVDYSNIDLSGIRGHRQVTDTYLVNLARAHSARLATFDQGLKQAHPDWVELIKT